MYDVRIIQSIVIVTCALRASTKTDENDNLQLSKIFCTPKDFSRVNFDHFEILERNNFDPQPTGISPKDESTKQQPKSFANAQVMLRIGGDDIKGKNSIECPPKVMNKVGQPYPITHATGIHHQANQIRSSANPFLPYSFVPQYSPISPYLTVAPLAPPFVFPGYMYNSPEFAASYGYNGIPSTSNNEYECENFLENTNRERTIANIINVNHPKILHSTDLKNDIVRETRSQHTDINNTDAIVEKEDRTKEANDPIVIFQADRREGIHNSAFKMNSSPEKTLGNGLNKERPIPYKKFPGFNERESMRPSYNMLYSHNILLDPLSREVFRDIRPISDDNLYKSRENVGKINEIVSIPKIRKELPIFETESPFSTFIEDDIYVPLTREDVYGATKGKLISVISDKDKKTQFFSHYTLSQLDPHDNKGKCIDSQPTKQDGILFNGNKDKKKPTLPNVELTLSEPPMCGESTLSIKDSGAAPIHIPALEPELHFSNTALKDIPLSKFDSLPIKKEGILSIGNKDEKKPTLPKVELTLSELPMCGESNPSIKDSGAAPIHIPALEPELHFSNSALKDISLSNLDSQPIKKEGILFIGNKDKKKPTLSDVELTLSEPSMCGEGTISIADSEAAPIHIPALKPEVHFSNTALKDIPLSKHSIKENCIEIKPCKEISKETPISIPIHETIPLNKVIPVLVPVHTDLPTHSHDNFVPCTDKKSPNKEAHVCKEPAISIQPCTELPHSFCDTVVQSSDSLEIQPDSKTVHKKTPISTATKKHAAKKTPVSVQPDKKIPVPTKCHSKTPTKASSSEECEKLPIATTCEENNLPASEVISINVAKEAHPCKSSIKEIPVSKTACEENLIESSSCKETPLSISANQKDPLLNDLNSLDFCEVPINEEILNILAAYIPIFKEAMEDECNNTFSLGDCISISSDGELTFPLCEDLPICNSDHIKRIYEETSTDIAVDKGTPISISEIEETPICITAKKEAPIHEVVHKENPIDMGIHKKENPICLSEIEEAPICITAKKEAPIHKGVHKETPIDMGTHKKEAPISISAVKESPISITTIKKEAPIFIPPIKKEAPIHIPDKKTSIELPVFKKTTIAMSSCEEAPLPNNACKESTIHIPSSTQLPPCDYNNIKTIHKENPIAHEKCPISIETIEETPISITAIEGTLDADTCKESPIYITATKDQPISMTMPSSLINGIPISFPAHKETSVDLAAFEKCPVSIAATKEAPISSIEETPALRESPIELSVHRDVPLLISSEDESSSYNCDNVIPVYEETPISVVSYEEIPISIAPKKETPISIAAKKEAPIHISSIKETPIFIPDFGESPIELSVHRDVPLFISSEEEPCPNEASSYNSDNVILVYEETPISVVSYEEIPISIAPKKETPISIAVKKEAPIQISPVKETPIFISDNKQTLIKSSVPEEVPIPITCTEVPPYTFDNIIPLYRDDAIDRAVYEECPISIDAIQETPISISATKEAPIDFDACKKTPISIPSVKETPISIPSIKKEAPIHIPPVIKDTSVDKEAPISVICTELPSSSCENIIPLHEEAAINTAVYQECPISMEAIQETPISISATKETPIGVDACKETPISIPAAKETPISIPSIKKEAPIYIPPVIRETPISIQANKEAPIKLSVDKEELVGTKLPPSSCESIKPIYEEAEMDTAVYQECPISIEAIQETPISLSATKETPIGVDACKETPISIPAAKETPISIPGIKKEAPIYIPPVIKETPISIEDHKEAPIKLCVDEEAPISIICTELPSSSCESIIPLHEEAAIDTAVYEECPISMETIRETPISISATKETPIGIDACKETPISIPAAKETPISIPSIEKEAPIYIPPVIKETPILIPDFGESPIELSVHRDVPLFISSKEESCPNEASSYNSDNVIPVYEETPISVVSYEEIPISIAPKKETPISIAVKKEAPIQISPVKETPIFSSDNKQTLIKSSVPEEVPIPITCTEVPPYTFDNIIPLYRDDAIDRAVYEECPISMEAIQETPISISASKETPIGVDACKETPISIPAAKETPISIPSIKKEAPIYIPPVIKETPISIQAQKEAPIELSVDNEAPKSIICTELPPSSCENIKPIYEEAEIIDTASCQECPISIEAIQETPISISATKETPIDIDACKETPISIPAAKETPISIPSIKKEAPIYIPPVIKETPISIEANKEAPIEMSVEKETQKSIICKELPPSSCESTKPIYEEAEIDVVYQECPISIVAIEETPISLTSTKEADIDLGAPLAISSTREVPLYIYSIIEETPISIPAFKDAHIELHKKEPCSDNAYIESSASHCDFDNIKPVHGETPIAVVDCKNTPKKETPISIPNIKKEAPIELTVHRDVPLFILNTDKLCSEDAHKGSLCSSDNIKPVHEEAPCAIIDYENIPISVAPKKETPISIPARKEAPLVPFPNNSFKESSIYIPHSHCDHVKPACEQTSKDVTAYEEAFVPSTVVKDEPISITTPKESPINMSSMKEAPILLAATKEAPISMTAEKEVPIDIAVYKETPISITTFKETPITITAKKEAPISIPDYKETPIESIICEETPICLTAVVFEESHIPLTTHKETCKEAQLSISPIHPISCVDTGVCQETPICVPVETDSNFYLYPVGNGVNKECHVPQHYDDSCSSSNNQKENISVEKELPSHVCGEEEREKSICNDCEYTLGKHTCKEGPTGFTYPETPVVVTLNTIEQMMVPSHSHNEMCYVDIVPQMEEWLNNSLVPYDCKEYGRKFLVSYPISQGIVPEIQKCNVFSGTPICNEELSSINCPCCQLKGFCDCMNCQCGRSTTCPYGKRFSTDVDSLFEIVPSDCSQSMDYKIKYPPQSSSHSKLSLPLPYSTGYSTSYKSTSLSGYLKVGGEVVYNGLSTVSGGGFYTDSHNHVYYQQPCIKQIVSKPFPNDVELQVNCYQPPKVFSFIPNHPAHSNYNKPCYVPTDNIHYNKLHPYGDKIISQRKYVASDDTLMVHKDTSCSYS